MRRIALLFAGGAVWLFLAAIPVLADGGPHIASVNSGSGGIGADSCAGCHRAHTAQGAMLLIEEQPAMCLVCHGASGTGATTDVETGIQYTPGGVSGTDRGAALGALRNGGFISARIGSGSAARLAYTSGTSVRQLAKVPVRTLGAQAVTSAHLPNVAGVLGAGTGPAWGNGPISATAAVGATVTMECTTCHNPHGNGAYRILNPIPAPVGTGFVPAGTGVTVTDAALPPAGDARNYTVIQAFPGTGTLLASQVTTLAVGSLAGDYFHRRVPWNGTVSGSYGNDAPNGLPITFNAQINAWCATCHTRITTSSNADNNPSAITYPSGFGSYNTDSGDAIFKYRHSTTSNKPCTTCHVAHGSNAQMTGAYSSAFDIVPGDATTETSSSLLLKIDNRGTCQACHDPTGTITTGTFVGPTPVPLVP